ncbi:DNA repair protein [Candidatus Galacturonibacter soehngenii]|uniref:DNA repair protein n=1 Tax=Candidatus Galacturonatibacter soehngenii TaxID=2307010 RepID=A0A7V7UCJ0_9FIRM|nr:DNA repair protein [Candidatus Galacturonibacter soehngenii]KAB1439730.1 DNA repair protein [Candidatus Galacturonibacter soehngenii]
MEDRIYFCIDLKSFYASVECVERKLDPLTTNLVVADPERSEKTICLAISPSMKALGIKNRCRVFQIPSNVNYIMAVPRMKLYIKYSADIYAIYLKYVAKEDIHVYSIDEAFLDVTQYLSLYQMDAKELAIQIMEDIKLSTGITATAGIGTNLYLAKIALDITAKHTKDNIGYLDETIFQNTLWKHKPLTDFWRIGAGTLKRLASIGITTMGEITQANEDMLYRLFGIDAELLIDHAWGRETTTMKDIKLYKPKSNSMSSGQILPRDYRFEECEIVVKEMTDTLCLDLAEKGLLTSSLTLVVGYSKELEMKSAMGTITMTGATNTYNTIIPYVIDVYRRIVDKTKPIRRLSISCNNVVEEAYEQYDLFTDPAKLEKERKIQKAAIEIKRKYGRNAFLRGMDLQNGATAIERNCQIGGHKSGD